MIGISLEQFETPKEQIGSALGNVKTTYWEAQGANIASSWDYNPTSSLFRLTEQTEAYNESNVYLNKDELNKQYADLGLFFDSVRSPLKGVTFINSGLFILLILIIQITILLF